MLKTIKLSKKLKLHDNDWNLLQEFKLLTVSLFLFLISFLIGIFKWAIVSKKTSVLWKKNFFQL